MAKVTIEFDSIEDKDEMEMCINGSKWYLVAWEMKQYLRTRLKYEELNDGQYQIVEQTIDNLNQLMRDNGVTFD
jgi:aminoglycoside phosphotransferase (APT) family kinase protein